MLKFVIFDLDETLYPTTNGLMQTIGARMREFIVNKYNLSPEDARTLQNYYWNTYGTTLRGLYLERQLDPREYLEYVHDVPLANYLAPDPKLRVVLERIPQEKVILTNSDAPHTRRVLEHLGVADQFTRIFDIVSNEYECKPARTVYSRVLNSLGARGDECALVEDLARNIPPARQLGIKTILLGNIINASTDALADAVIETIYEVAAALARLPTTD
jgi:putative hydrolase of the HAD superfamily